MLFIFQIPSCRWCRPGEGFALGLDYPNLWYLEYWLVINTESITIGFKQNITNVTTYHKISPRSYLNSQNIFSRNYAQDDVVIILFSLFFIYIFSFSVNVTLGHVPPFWHREAAYLGHQVLTWTSVDLVRSIYGGIWIWIKMQHVCFKKGLGKSRILLRARCVNCNGGTPSMALWHALLILWLVHGMATWISIAYDPRAD